MFTRLSVPRLRSAGLLSGAAVLLASGCIERRLQITSDPPGATVWLNDVQIGTTPTEAEFQFFGTYDVRLHKQGYEPLATKRKAEAPFYEYPGPDLIAEALPGTHHTIIKWDFKLEPALELRGDPAAARADLITRGKEMQGMVLPPEQAKAEALKAEAQKADAEKAQAEKAAAEKAAEQPAENAAEKAPETGGKEPAEKAPEQPPIEPAKGE